MTDKIEFTATTWQKSSHFAAGVTKCHKIEIYIDKIAEYAYKYYVENELIHHTAYLKSLYEKTSGDAISNIELQQEIIKAIDSALYYRTKKHECVMLYKDYRGEQKLLKKTHNKVLKQFHEREITKIIIDIITESSVHELIHALYADGVNAGLYEKTLFGENTHAKLEFATSYFAKRMKITEKNYGDEYLVEDTNFGQYIDDD